MTDHALEVARLSQEVQVERERRVMAALWGSRDEDCPRAFSLYRHEDDAHEFQAHGVLAYGVVWGEDLSVTVRWRRFAPQYADVNERNFISLPDLRSRLDDGVKLVWLSEDIDELTKVIREGVEREIRLRAKADQVRQGVASLIYMNDRPAGSLTWPQTLRLADEILRRLFEEAAP